MDAVTKDLNEYLDWLDQRDKEDARILDAAAELMDEGGEYDPFSCDGLGQAIAELSDEDMTRLGDLLRRGNYLAAGTFLANHAREVWEPLATKQAEFAKTPRATLRVLP